MPEYLITVKLTFDNLISSDNKAKAIAFVKESMKEEHNLDITDDEIVEVTNLDE